MGCLAALLLPVLPPAARAVTPLQQWIRRDDHGVLRYADGKEVRLWGVNYLLPFSVGYRNVLRLKLDPKEVIRNDLDDMKRMEVDLVRVRVTDREISAADGSLLENGHVDLLDYLIDQCRERGIRVLLTPISWYPSAADSTDGFSDHALRHQLATLASTFPSQEKYLRALAGHRNAYTGLTYAEDPAVALWEIIHDPQPVEVKMEEVKASAMIDYATRMRAALREAGVRAPILYSAYALKWADSADGELFDKSGVDGWTFSTYHGQSDGSITRPPFLNPRTYGAWYMRHKPPFQWGSGYAMAVSEFDFMAIETTYMFPAYGRNMAASGVQAVAYFQYDSEALADHNPCYRLDWMNLRYTPAKAVSFMIGGRLFRKTHRGIEIEKFPRDDWRFDGVYLSGAHDVALYRDAEEGILMVTHSPADPLPGTLEDYREYVAADSTGLIGFDGERFVRALFDPNERTVRLELEPRVEVRSNPFETGRWNMNVRFCRRVARLHDDETTVRLRLDDDTVAVYRLAEDGSRKRLPVTRPEFPATPGRYLVELDPGE